MTQGCSGKNISGFFWQNFFTVLLAMFVLVMGMLDSKPVVAASPFTPDKLVGTYALTSARVVKEKGATLTYPEAMTVSKGGNGTILITNKKSQQAWQGKIDLNSGTGRCNILIVAKSSGKILSSSAVNVEVRFEEQGGGNYVMHILGATYQKKGTGKSSSTATKNETVKTETNQPNADDDDGGITIYHIGGGLFLVIAGGAVAFFAVGGGGGGGGGASAGNPADVPPPDEPATFVYTDPATGAQSIYEKDPETGQWVNPYTGGVLDPDDLNRFNDQRILDRNWMDDEVKNLEDRNTAFDNDLKNDWQDMLDREAEIDRQGRKDQMAINTGTYGMTDDQRKAYLTNRQNGYETDMKNAHRTANNWDTVVQTAEVVQTAADIGVDTLAVVTAPVGGGLVADGYAVLKNIGGGAADAAASGRSIAGGIAQGITNAAVDVAQNHAGTKWQKLGSYVGGEGLKGGIEAGIKGESVVKGVFKGAGKGITKIGVEKVANGISDAASKTNFNNFKNHYNKINNVYSKGISQKSTNALRQMNYQKFASKETGNLWKNGIAQGVGKNLVTKVFD